MLESIGEEASDDPKGARKFTSFGHLALYKQPEEDDQQASFISAFTTPGPKERATSNHKKVRETWPKLEFFLQNFEKKI